MQRLSLQTDDFEELQEAAKTWDQEYFQMSQGRFKGSIELTQVGTRQIFRERWGRKIMYRGIAPPGSFGFAIPLDQPGTATWVGKPACVDTVILQAPNKEADLLSSVYLDTLGLAVSEKEFHWIVSAFSDHDDISDSFHGAITLQRQVANQLRRIGLDFLRVSKSAPSVQETQISWLSEQFVRLVLWELVDAHASSDFVYDLSKPAKTVTQATELVVSDQTSRIGLADICKHCGVSARTLHYAFQDVTGMSPATWLRRIRLNRVHKTLLRSAPDEVLVKRVALENGFIHLGHFTKQYQRLFGCLPSHTLRSR